MASDKVTDGNNLTNMKIMSNFKNSISKYLKKLCKELLLANFQVMKIYQKYALLLY